MSEHRECWEKNLAARDLHRIGTTRLYPVALGVTRGELRMTVERGNSGHTHVAADGDGVAAEVQTLDSYELHDVGFVKIDCEGYERFVLEGAEETILREKPAIVVEQKPGQGPRYGLDQSSAIAWLQERGATVHWNVGEDYCVSWV